MFAFTLAIFFVLANSFFVAAEFALAKVRPTALSTLAANGDRKAALALGLTRKLDAYLTATQLGITFASLALGWVGEPAIASLLAPLLKRFAFSAEAMHAISLTIAFSTISALHIIVGELIPKSLAIQKPEAVARQTARLLHWFYIVVFPALWVLNGISNATLRLLGLPPADHAEGKLSVEELRLVVQASFPEQGLESKKREILERVLAGFDRPIRSIMVPRVDIVMLSLAMGFEDCLQLARKHGYSRYPISETGDPDDIVGYIYLKDVMVSPVRTVAELKACMREVLFMPEGRSIGDALTDFQRATTPIAIVVDEYGGTAGLLTQEDAVEALVGDIQDELDKEAPRVQVTADGSVTVDGNVSWHELALHGVELGAPTDADTVGGQVISALGRMPRVGDRVVLAKYEAVVEEVRRRRVRRVLLRPMEQRQSASMIETAS